MNTSRLKSFAQKARSILKDGVHNSLLYWGFDKNGHVIEKPEEISGGCIFRGEVFNDPGILRKWHHLHQYINRHTIDDAIEQASYTWFNRLMAISILEHNKLERPVIYTDVGQDPPLLAEARTGKLNFLPSSDHQRVKALIFDHHDEEAFGMLLTSYCRSHPLLNRIFGGIDDFTELLLPSNLLSPGGIIHVINHSEAIIEEDYLEVELIGWLYQFYISKKKDEVFANFKKNKKARAEDIPAATQIFTPRWIVRYMVENTIGKVWLNHYPDSPLRSDMKYYVETEDSKDTDIISSVSDLKLLDPAVGSGHVLVVGFELFLRMYQEEGYTTTQAIKEVFKNNLFGLDIDDRAAQLACFAVLLKASFYDPGILQEKILPNIYAMPEADEFSRQEIYEFLGPKGEKYYKEVANALTLLRQGKNIGSALKLNILSETRQFLIARLFQLTNRENELDFQISSIFVRIKPFIKSLIALTDSYESVVTNPPYMGSANFNIDLKSYIETNYSDSKGDLFTVFMDVCYNFLNVGGRYGMINQDNWMFKPTYLLHRMNIASCYSIESLIHLGPRVFSELSGEVVQSVTFCVSKQASQIKIGKYFKVTKVRTSDKKEEFFKSNIQNPYHFNLSFLPLIPDMVFAYWLSNIGIKIFNNEKKLVEFAKPKKGIATGDDDRFFRFWHEISFDKIKFDSIPLSCSIDFKWIPINKGGGIRKWSGNFETIVNWEKDGQEIKNHRSPNGKLKSRPQNLNFSFLPGITYNIVSSKGFSGRLSGRGFMMSDTGPTIFDAPNDYALLALLNSKVGEYFFDALCPGYKYDTGAVGKFPVMDSIFNHEELINLSRENVELSLRDWNSHETSWEFTKNPIINKGTTLKQAFNKYENNLKEAFIRNHRNEEQINKILLGMYKLTNEISNEVYFDHIHLYKDEIDRNKFEKLEQDNGSSNTISIELQIIKSEIIKQLISYFIGCLAGRYHLNKVGLHIAHQNTTNDEYKYKYNGRLIEIDPDAIFPILGDESPFSDDVLHKMMFMIEVIWGDDCLTENINFIEESLGTSLEKFLTTKFWLYHVKMYQKHPIYWLFESPKGNFKVLTYMHRMDKFTVQKIRLNYLHRYIDHLIGEISRMKQNGNDKRKVEKLEDSLLDCRVYSDILKPLADRQITFDLDDGVKNNYKLFEGAVKPI